jgi:hypothetical protein
MFEPTCATVTVALLFLHCQHPFPMAVRKFLYDGLLNPLEDLLTGHWAEGPHRRLDDFLNDTELVASQLLLAHSWSLPKVVAAGDIILGILTDMSATRVAWLAGTSRGRLAPHVL